MGLYLKVLLLQYIIPTAHPPIKPSPHSNPSHHQNADPLRSK